MTRYAGILLVTLAGACSPSPAAPSKSEPTAAKTAPPSVVSPSPQPSAAQAELTNAPQGQLPVSAAAKCEFSAPERFVDRVVKWEGGCEDNKAHGLGALRAYPKAGSKDAVLIFFGLLEHGQPKLGVIDTPEGYVAGQFAGGKQVPSEDPNDFLRAFREASAAASLVRDRLAAAGNAASAAFYAKKAESLTAQIE